MKVFAIALFGLTTLLSGFGCDDNGRRRRDDDHNHHYDRGRNYGDRDRHDNDRWRHGSYRHSDGFLAGKSVTGTSNAVAASTDF